MQSRIKDIYSFDGGFVEFESDETAAMEQNEVSDINRRPEPEAVDEA